jgi:hypothetical protein
MAAWLGISMPKNRLEAFSDGVIAIVITLLVLEIHVPPNPLVTNQEMLNAILKLAPHLVAYMISFLVCAVWWVAHHALIHDLRQVDTALLWANNLFLLGLAFLPFPTALLGQHPAQPIAAACYGVVGASNCLELPRPARVETERPAPNGEAEDVMQDAYVRASIWTSLPRGHLPPKEVKS